MRVFLVFLLVVMVIHVVGCEDEDDYLDHVPPEDLGSMIIDNKTYDEINLYVNGDYTSQVGEYRERIFDLAPGIYRVVLDEEDGNRTYREDIDVLEGRLTVLQVREDFSSSEYNVDIFFE